MQSPRFFGSPPLTQDSPIAGLLSVREYSCLELLSCGMTTVQVGVELSISESTTAKHLSSVRSKLGVSSTRQAVALFLKEQITRRDNAQAALRSKLASVSASDRFSSLSSKLERCDSLELSFTCVAEFVKELGFTHSILGIVAEPFGRITNGARLLRSSFPSQVMKLYDEAGGAQVDPVPKSISTKRQCFAVDQQKLTSMHTKSAPSVSTALSRAMVDFGTHSLLVVPGYDKATDAPYCFSVAMDRAQANDLKKHSDKMIGEIEAVSSLFWLKIRRESLLAAESGLLGKHREALRYSAWDFKTAAAAERMNLSTRRFEMILSQARTVMGAQTTASAVYRATVYGALR